MFENLASNLKNAWHHLLGKNKISERDLDQGLETIKKALIDADVALAAVNHFIATIKAHALNQTIEAHLKPQEFLIKLVKKELINLLGAAVPLNVGSGRKPAVILLVGLQGSGKTTTAAKLAKYLQDHHKKTVMLASCDIYRPAALAQLEQVSAQVGASFFKDESNSVKTIALNALNAAKLQGKDVLIIDTAGRLHIDTALMEEAMLLHRLVDPVETLFVVDGMVGQDAAKIAHQFNDRLALSGVILTKMDGDLRGGAALSVKYVTGKPIKFYTTGEKLDLIEVFDPEKIASIILSEGFGQILALIEELEKKIDKEKAEKLAQKALKGEFNFILLREQLLQMQQMGGISSLIDKIPGISGVAAQVKSKVNDAQIKVMIALINSMTPKERIYPALLNVSSRKHRICKGSGTKPMDLNKLIKHFQHMQKMFKSFSNKGNMFKMLQAMKNKLPPGVIDF